MIVLSRDDVRAVLDLDRLVDALADAMADLSAGRTLMPPRGSVVVPDRHGTLFSMSAFLPSSGVLATKLVGLFPLNLDRPTHQAVICCFDPADGRPLALMDGTYITAMRTAAGSALATRLLARRDARTACVIGTGVQARAHVTLLARQPGLARIQVAGRDAAKVARLVDEFAEPGAARGGGAFHRGGRAVRGHRVRRYPQRSPRRPSAVAARGHPRQRGRCERLG
jgi:alanine dehydrogenase